MHPQQMRAGVSGFAPVRESIWEACDGPFVEAAADLEAAFAVSGRFRILYVGRKCLANAGSQPRGAGRFFLPRPVIRRMISLAL